MESKTKELVKAGHELVVLLGNQHGMIDAASLVQRLTAQLDITAAALKQSLIDSGCYKRGMEESSERLVQLAADNLNLKSLIADGCKWDGEQWVGLSVETPATDAWQREQLVQAHKEGAYFVANRMLAAWEAGFIEDTAKNAADIARMILTSTEFMVDAPEGDFDRSFADGVLEDIAAQLRNGEVV